MESIKTMIEFNVRIEEVDGQVGMRSTTPATVGTPKEIQIALIFKALLAQFAEKTGATTVHPWKSPDNKASTDN